jgi:hypothetical protein
MPTTEFALHASLNKFLELPQLTKQLVNKFHNHPIRAIKFFLNIFKLTQSFNLPGAGEVSASVSAVV